MPAPGLPFVSDATSLVAAAGGHYSVNRVGIYGFLNPEPRPRVRVLALNHEICVS